MSAVGEGVSAMLFRHFGDTTFSDGMIEFQYNGISSQIISVDSSGMTYRGKSGTKTWKLPATDTRFILNDVILKRSLRGLRCIFDLRQVKL